ncbi:MAG: RNA polymerase sigma factor [Bacteroidia bacterium]|nr:RNA polymerase sigma factor [Bacteroidota bacterium]
MKNSDIIFKDSVKDHYRSLRGFALKLTQNSEDANDLIQETMLKALNNEDKFEKGTNLSGWLYTIMRNIFINNYRRMVKSQTFLDSTENQFFLNNINNATRNRGEANLVMKEINNAINDLSDNLKVPFMMSFRGYKYEEIASQLSIPLGTVKIRIHTARQKLKEKLNVYNSLSF